MARLDQKRGLTCEWEATVTREEIEKRMDDAARKYVETHDEEYKEEVWELARQLVSAQTCATTKA
jgi:hypothetical protein